jgi:pyruvyltransferase
MKAYYYNNGNNKNPEWSKNWGDIIGPTIIKHFSKSERIEATEQKSNSKLVSIGSVIAAARPGDLIWGTGVIEHRQYLPHLREVTILACRGPLSREHLLYLGHDVPEVYGDPGLLYPQIYNPDVEKTHEWGIIPHYIDLEHPMVKHLIKQGVKFIDICAGEKEFVDQLKSVEKVLSSSLHGLIAADAYGIPNARIKLTGDIVGGDFKYKDYAASVNRSNWQANVLDTNTNLNDIELNYSIDWDSKPLLDNAPWNIDKYKPLFFI